MALCSFRIRRALSLSSTFHHFLPFHHPKSPVPAPSTTQLTAATAPASFSQPSLPFTSTTILSLSSGFRPFNPETDEIGPDTILFEGCDYKHWLITIDFPKDPRPPREEMIEFYVKTAAQVFGSVEEAKKKIYALSTTTYDGFQVECSEETSEKFKNLPGVVFVLPDSYIDPINKEYGGDKYVNGDILTRPPPIQFEKRDRYRRPRERMPYQQGNTGYNNVGPMRDGQNYGPPRQQNYGPPLQQNYSPPPQQNYGPPPQQNYGPSPQQNYGPPQQQNYGPPQPGNYHAQGKGEVPQGNQRSQVPPEQSGFSRDNHNFNPSKGGSFERGPVDAQGQAYGQNHLRHGDDQRGNAPAWEQRNFPSMGNTMTGQGR